MQQYPPNYQPPPQNWFQRMPTIAKVVFILGALLLLACCSIAVVGFGQGFIQGFTHGLQATPTP